MISGAIRHNASKLVIKYDKVITHAVISETLKKLHNFMILRFHKNYTTQEHRREKKQFQKMLGGCFIEFITIIMAATGCY